LTVGSGVASLVIQLVQFVSVRRSHLCAGFKDPASGYASYMMAASPETCGHAMDVPDMVNVSVSLDGPVERTSVPGA
jgi:hypothetical protein